ncbi:xaa-Pro aminopeptidase 3 isoform X1 [Nilaparvata lugens]|uniref:xaa-Pro aminopeptidase 3 isoform X1 n=1 Tax=Nilaparvata lugens TaxID=108931 RepID=UPI00193CD00C|nr:xaa-Pro aminopeptidase 3 isoform X1 [Nilaparvata lugens]
MFKISRILSRSSIRSSLKIPCSSCSSSINQPTSASATQPIAGLSNDSRELYGQPTSSTHPHLMVENELVPGITKDEFLERRHKFMKNLIESSAPGLNHIVVIPSASKVYMTEKIPYVFRQNSDFLYLTGCQEPDSAMVMVGRDADKFISTMFVRKRDAHSELWDGPRTGVERAPEFFGIEQALPFTELKAFLKMLMKEQKNAKLWFDYSNKIHPEVSSIMSRFSDEKEHQGERESPRAHIHQMRLVKSPAEQGLMQRACQIASEAIVAGMAATGRVALTEHQLFATLDYECRMRGAEWLAYPPVVATGNNATIIHYINNTQHMRHGQLVLVDSGCEYHGYASDITRTWPVNGKFSSAQTVLYELVLELQLEVIDLCRDMPSLDNLFQYMCRSLGKKLKEAGVLSSTIPSENLAKCVFQMAFEFCPHHVSHYLGMDIHDTATIKRSINLKPGMVVTVEPGVYINQNNTDARPEFRGCGIRIEDDILVTEGGPIVLSESCPKEIAEIEKIMSSKSTIESS